MRPTVFVDPNTTGADELGVKAVIALSEDDVTPSRVKRPAKSTRSVKLFLSRNSSKLAMYHLFFYPQTQIGGSVRHS